MMYLQSLATANPPRIYTQRECFEIAQRPHVRARLNKRSQLVVRKVLTGDSGIETRHIAVADFEHVFDRTADELNAAFRREAPRLAANALRQALAAADLQASDLDALFVCTCTGYLCPGVSSYVAELLEFRPDAYLQDLVGLGCGAAIPTLRSAHGFLAAQPDARVACVAVEISSAAFYVDDDIGVLVSACLFADGAAASIWAGRPGPSGLEAFDFQTLHIPRDRDLLRFEMREGKLRNLLDRSVPERAAAAVGCLWSRRGDRPVARVAVHPGGRDVLLAIEPVLAPHDLGASSRVLRSKGNMSSPSVLFVAEEILREDSLRAGDLWLASFGAGFSAHSCRFGRHAVSSRGRKRR